ncbi:hypothetical protein BC936DRAFT_138911 [Jimgerdemannia flammicorona]|uniref:Uncharacterized protein n=1 Tax=Jimgerdemannia flammicorona TaxID=994334 RepID=A0A433BDZ1_9FUNG|nr:hypothetical protein BC936DRAFT_138911 [Jimgerdemannia flammicorona]
MGQTVSKTRKLLESRKNQQGGSNDRDYSLPPTCDSKGNPVTEDSKLIDGRQFKKSGSPVYLLPNDIGVGNNVIMNDFLRRITEFERLNLQHYVVSNYRAPVTEDLKRGIKVIDVG